MRVNRIYPSIQGEGFHAGTPMVVLRLQGCTVGCSWCDTKQSWDPAAGGEMSVAEIHDEIENSAPAIKTVLITGGEPFEQDLNLLTSDLHHWGYAIHIETSGIARDGNWPHATWDWLTVSPKEGHSKAIVSFADEIKVVVTSKAQALDAIQRYPVPKLSLQPEWSRRKELIPQLAELCVTYGCRLSLQLHKYAALP